MQGVRPLGKGFALEMRSEPEEIRFRLQWSDEWLRLCAGDAWRNHCKGFVHARVRFRRKQPCETRGRVLWLRTAAW